MIKCNKLTKYYKDESVPAIKDVSLNVGETCVFGFLGPNGAGKTTTIKILTGLMSPSSGDFEINGKKPNDNKSDIRKDIGYLGQDQNLYPWMRCRELLVFVGSLFNLSDDEIQTRADMLLQMSGLKEASKKRVSALSGGMRQRLGIAQAMMGKPKVLFLDEPTSALDPIGRKEVLDFILKIKSECTVFMSTHILSDAERVCDEIAIINKGKIITQAKTNEIKNSFSSKNIEIAFSDKSELKRFESLLSKTRLANENLIYNEDLLTINPSDLVSVKKDLINLINENSIDIVRFELTQANLEDVFVKLVGGQNE